MPRQRNGLPPFEELMNPVIWALRDLGGSGTIEEIRNEVTRILNLPEQQIEQLHNPNTGSRTELEYRLAWARTYLGAYGILENSRRGVWALTSIGAQTEQIEPQIVTRYV